MKTQTLILTLSLSLISVLGLISCSSTLPKVSPPDYLEEEIRRNPGSEPLTPYRLNGPFGGPASGLAARGKTIVVGTASGRIYRSRVDQLDWSVSKTEISAKVNDILLAGNQFFAATDQGILRSSDDGLTWQKLYAGPPVRQLIYFQNSFLVGISGSVARVNPQTGATSVLIDDKTLKEIFDSGQPLIFLLVVDDQAFAGSSTRLLRSSTSNLKKWGVADSGLGISESGANLVSLVLNGKNLFALTRKTTNDKSSTELHLSRDLGASWQQLPIPIDAPDNKLFSTAGELFLAGEGTLYHLSDLNWNNVGLPFPNTPILSVATTEQQTIIATNQGIYSKTLGDDSWKNLSSGFISWNDPGSIAVTTNNYFAILDGQLFKTSDVGKTWTHMTFNTSAPSGKTNLQEKSPRQSPTKVSSIATVGDSIFTIAENQLYAGKASDRSLAPVSLNLDIPSSEPPVVQLLTSSDNKDLYIGVTIENSSKGDATQSTAKDFVIWSKDSGQSWEQTKGLPDQLFADSIFGQEGALTFATPNAVYLREIDRARVFRLKRDQNNWEEISSGLRQDSITAFGGNDQIVYAAASRPAEAEKKVLPQLFKLNNVDNANKWIPISSQDLTGRVSALWADPSHPEVIIAGTSEGLFWSNDSGDRFHQVVPLEEQSFHEVSAIAELNGQLFINTESGEFFLYDQIPRARSFAQWRDFLNENKWPIISSAVLLLALVVLSTRLISILLQLDLWGINQVAPVFYLLPFGRWKLYRGYRAHLLSATDLKESVKHYVDLPYKAGNLPLTKVNEHQKLSELFTTLLRSQRIAVIADGGCGKSTLCAYLADRTIRDGDVFGSKRIEPVIVDGLSYTGDILNTITNALRQDRAYVNKGIVSSQLAAGNLLIIFDGFTEIKETYLHQASSEDLPQFIQQHPDTPFLFTSRSELPQTVVNALGEPITVRLATIDDDDTVKAFLSQYLKRRDQEVQALIKEIGIKFKTLPRIPLLLKLVAAIYDTKGQVPKNTAALFGDYAEHVLRPEATGIDEAIGLNYAIRHLVGETYLKSGGDRGLTKDRGVQLLNQIKETIAGYDIKIAPLKLLQILINAGLYKEVRQNLKFFHDSFESYFAALVLHNDFLEKQFDLIKKCSQNPRLFETWQFLNELLDDDINNQTLKQLEEEAAKEQKTSAYQQSQRDPSVDYFVSVTRNTKSYSLELASDLQRQTFHLSISHDEFATLAKRMRRKMKNFASEIIQKNFVIETEELRAIAHLGNYAFREFFSKGELATVFAKLQAASPGASLQIAADSCFFPWEFLYPLDPKGPLSVEDFWGMKHVISRLVVQNVSSVTSETRNVMTSKRPYIGLLADDQIQGIAAREIPFFENLDANNKIKLERIKVGASSNIQNVVSELKESLSKAFDVIHIACKIQYDEETPLDSRIEVAQYSSLSLSDLEVYGLALAGSPLIVLNASESGNIDPQRAASFAGSFLKYGARGVIATESIIPNISATTFTPLLYEYLLAGESLGASLLKVRRAMWTDGSDPMGLFYSLYAPPSLTLTVRDL